MYQVINTILVGIANAGRALHAQLYDSDGSANGAVVTSTFLLRPGALGIFVHVASVPDGHVGWMDYFFSDTPGVVIGTWAINPREFENADVKSSVLSAQIANVGASVAASQDVDVAPGRVAMRRGVTLAKQLSNLVIPSSWSRIVLTVKRVATHPDSMALLQLQVSNPGDAGDGLRRINGADAANSADGSLAADQPNGIIDIRVEDNVAVALAVDSYVYDIKTFFGSSESVVTAPMVWDVLEIVTEQV